MADSSGVVSTIKHWLTWRPGGYLRASGALFGWLLVRAMSQAVLVIALARLLGAADYGHFVAVLAIATFFSPLAGLGLQGVLLINGARNPRGLPHLLATALRLWWPSTLLFGLVGVAVALVVLPRGTSVAAISALVLAEVSSSSLVELLARVQQALHHPQRYGAMLAGLALVRVAALAGYALLANATVDGWMWAYALSSVAYAAWLLAWMCRAIHPSHSASTPAWAMAREGLPFALGALSLRLQAEFNKPVLAQGGYALAGNFSAAQRAVDFAILPLIALQETLWPRLYASPNPNRQMLLTGMLLVLLALAGGVFLVLFAPLLPHLLGSGFDAGVRLLQLLALLPALQVIRNLGNFLIIAQKRTQLLTAVYVISGLAAVTLTAPLVATYGLEGAVIAAYATETTAIFIQVGCQIFLKGTRP